MTAKSRSREQGAAQLIPLEQLRAAPWNARKTVERAALEELEGSIRQHGVLVRLLVRPLEPLADVLQHPEAAAASPRGYEIVCGHRRYAAAKQAGLASVPCEVRELDLTAAHEVALIDNLQREDMPPMEEAEAYGQLLERPGATIETVAAALAKAPSYVGRRVQLLKAIEPVRQALKAGAIEVGHALELARLSEAMQRELLAQLHCGYTGIEPDDIDDEEAEEGVCRYCGCTEDDACELEEGASACTGANAERTICSNPKCLAQFRQETGQSEPGQEDWHPTHDSVAQLRAAIAKRTLLPLGQAPFPLDANLEPVPCVNCPKRAGNAQLLFDDCAQDTCTDRRCYDAKVQAWIAAELEAAKREKRTLLKLTRSWSSDKSVVGVSEYNGVRVLTTPSECPHGEEGIWIDGEHVGRRAMVCRKADCKTHRGGSHGTRGNHSRNAAPDPKRKGLLAAVKAEKEYRASLFKAIAGTPPQKEPAGTALIIDRLWTRVVDYVFRRSDTTKYAQLAEATGIPKAAFDYGSREKKLKDHVAALTPWQKALYAAIAIEDSELTVHEHDVPGSGALDKRRGIDLETIAEIVGVDWKKLLKDSGQLGRSQQTVSHSETAPQKQQRGRDKKILKRIQAAVKKRRAEPRGRAMRKPKGAKTGLRPAASRAAKKGGRK